MSCLFCTIAAGDIPVDPVYADDDVMAMTDINPQAPQHLLVIPKAHFANVTELAVADTDLLAKVFATAARLGKQIGSDGFRLVANTGPLGGQTVDHVHVHVLAGRPMTWPPG